MVRPRQSPGPLRAGSHVYVVPYIYIYIYIMAVGTSILLNKNHETLCLRDVVGGVGVLHFVLAVSQGGKVNPHVVRKGEY